MLAKSRHRSYTRIDNDDLTRLWTIALNDRLDFFLAHNEWRTLYARRAMATCLCQGAALHYLDLTTGINDFDVYTFYAQHPERRWCARRYVYRDFANAKFGCSRDKPEFIGRRVDIFGRDIDCGLCTDPVSAIQTYLHDSKTQTAFHLAQKAVIWIDPHRLGYQIWPPQ